MIYYRYDDEVAIGGVRVGDFYGDDEFVLEVVGFIFGLAHVCPHENRNGVYHKFEYPRSLFVDTKELLRINKGGRDD